MLKQDLRYLLRFNFINLNKYLFTSLTFKTIKKMKIRNFLKIASFLLCMAFAIPFNSTAANGTKPLTDSTADARMLTNIINRVTEIQQMDKSNLSTTEKRELKKELKDMKQKADGLNSRVYLSVGAIIIIILLLILIL